MFFARKVWCIADVLSISPSSGKTEGLWGNQGLKSGVQFHADRKVKSCHWLEFVAANWSKNIWNYVNKNIFIDSVDSQGPEFENGFMLFLFASLLLSGTAEQLWDWGAPLVPQYWGGTRHFFLLFIILKVLAYAPLPPPPLLRGPFLYPWHSPRNPTVVAQRLRLTLLSIHTNVAAVTVATSVTSVVETVLW